MNMTNIAGQAISIRHIPAQPSPLGPLGRPTAEKWAVMVDGKFLASYPSREKAMEAAKGDYVQFGTFR